MKKYNRIMLGRAGKFAKACYEEGYIGVDFDLNFDLSDSLYDNWRDFNKKFIPVWLQIYPEKSKTAAGVSCGFLWTIIKGLNIGDVVLSPSGEGFYYVGTIKGNYYYVPGAELPHRRKVEWMEKVIYRKDMSKSLQNSTGSIGTCCDITKYAEELEELIAQSAEETPAVKPEIEHKEAKSDDERSLHKQICN
jgi:restriction system protein